MANIVVCAVIIALVGAAAKSYVKQRKSGGCGCGCAGCKNKCGNKDEDNKQGKILCLANASIVYLYKL